MYWSRCFRAALFIALVLAFTAETFAQERQPSKVVEQVIERLDVLEKQNEALLKEIQALRQELKNATADGQSAASTSTPIEERVEASEERIKEQSATKVGASQRFPIALTGMFLFDAFTTSGSRNTSFLNTYGDYSLGSSLGGATLRQSIIGLNFFGPHIVGDGQIHGTLAMDFYGGSSSDVLRIRRGVVSFDWRRRSITFGQDKPLIAPLQPTSFARVGVPPLSGAGNLWLWLPQARYEERLLLSPGTQITGQASLLQTNESYSNVPANNHAYAGNPRPAGEVRLEFQRSWNDQPRLTLGVGGHISTTHVLGQSIPSRVLSADVVYKPKAWLQLSGTILSGENFGNLGGLPLGVTLREQRATAIRGSAGWAQLALPVTNRLTFDIYAGRQLNSVHDLSAYDAFRTLTYAGNVLYRIAPNVVLGFEGAQSRLEYLNGQLISTERYDATAAYLF